MFTNENKFRKAIEEAGIDDAPRREHQQDLRRRVLTAFDEAGASDALPWAFGRPAGLTLRRRLMQNRFLQVGAASLAAACVLAVLLWSVGPGAGVALADVQALIEETRTVVYELTAYRNGKCESTAKVMFMEPGRMRAEWPGMTSIFDWNEGKILSLAAEDKTAISGVVTDMENHYYRNWLADLKAIVGSDTAEELGQKELFGCKAKGWRIPDEGGTCAVWADAKTGELLQVEFEQGKNKMVMSQFVINPELDESLFDMTPPQDYKLLPKIEMAEADASEQDIIMLLQVWVSGNGGQFPDKLDPAKFGQVAAKANWRDLGIDSQEKAQEWHQAIGQAFYLLHGWKLEWGYVGKGVKAGQADRPVLWHRSEGSEMYRVIYGDFSVAEVSPESLKELIQEDAAAGDQSSQQAEAREK